MYIHKLAEPELSQAAKFMKLPKEERDKRLSQLSKQELYDLQYNWHFWRRPKQVIPDDKSIILLRTGRGWGKSRVLSEWVRERWQRGGMERSVLIADTPKDAIQFNIKGPSGLLKVHPHYERPRFKPSETKLIWPLRGNQFIHSEMLYFSAEDPDSLRGMNADTVVIDELAKAKKQDEVMEQVDMVLREGDDVKLLIATTPRPTPLIRELIEERDDVFIIGGSSYENTALNKKFFDRLEKKYEGTRTGRQEVHGELLTDLDNALWKREDFIYIHEDRYEMSDFERIVIGVDPSGAADKEQNWDRPNKTGIIVAGKLSGEDCVVLLDNMSAVMGPRQWGATVAHLYDKWEADLVIAEINYGGAMVEHTLHSAYENLPVKVITSSRGKHIRAEPVAMLYSQHKVFHRQAVDDEHISLWSTLEDQMCNTTAVEYEGQGSPDEMDATVFAVTELLIDGPNSVEVF